MKNKICSVCSKPTYSVLAIPKCRMCSNIKKGCTVSVLRSRKNKKMDNMKS